MAHASAALFFLSSFAAAASSASSSAAPHAELRQPAQRARRRHHNKNNLCLLVFFLQGRRLGRSRRRGLREAARRGGGLACGRPRPHPLHAARASERGRRLAACNLDRTALALVAEAARGTGGRCARGRRLSQAKGSRAANVGGQSCAVLRESQGGRRMGKGGSSAEVERDEELRAALPGQAWQSLLYRNTLQ
eukprot:scaffold5310_cov378-Prasinococcus_capsulatus_cf.AAC.17